MTDKTETESASQSRVLPTTEITQIPPSVRSDDPEEITVMKANWMSPREPTYLIVRRGEYAWMFAYQPGSTSRVLPAKKVRYYTAKEAPNTGHMTWSGEFYDYGALTWSIDPFGATGDEIPSEITLAARATATGDRPVDGYTPGKTRLRRPRQRRDRRSR